MKALTILEPWATLVALQEKKVETRSRRISHRGPLLIHSGKRFTDSAKLLCMTEPYYTILTNHGLSVAHLKERLGVILAAATLVDVVPVNELNVSPQERAFGNYDAGRF